MVVTELVSQLQMFLLKAVASSNIWLMSVTELVFQLPISWLNWLAPINIWLMFVTELVSQLPISWLNEVLERLMVTEQYSNSMSVERLASLMYAI